MLRLFALLCTLIVSLPAVAQYAPANAEWNQPIAPFRIADNLYYVGVKGGIEYAGWSDHPLMESLGLPDEWLETTRRRTLEIVGEIRSGRVEVHPRDRENCRFCDSKDICRVETQATVLVQVAEGV